MDSPQTILFFWHEMELFHLTTIVFIHSCCKLIACIVLFIIFVWTLFFLSSSSYFIISFSLSFLSHAVVMRKNFPFSVNLFQGNFLLLYPCMDQGLAKSALSYFEQCYSEKGWGSSFILLTFSCPLLMRKKDFHMPQQSLCHGMKFGKAFSE